jgi:hypothetical protein
LHVFASLGHVDRIFMTPILVAFNASNFDPGHDSLVHATPDDCLQLALCLIYLRCPYFD